MRKKLTPSHRGNLFELFLNHGYQVKLIHDRGDCFLVRARKVSDVMLMANTPYGWVQFDKKTLLPLPVQGVVK